MSSNSSESAPADRRGLRASWLSRIGARLKRLNAGTDVWGLTVFLAALAAFMTVVPFRGFENMIGDNIAQVGYWRILVAHQFVGSLGAASMKPGLVVLLGSAHDLSLALFGSTVLIKVVFALAAAGLVTIVASIARQDTGKIAGVGAIVYLMTETPVPAMFIDGTSMIVFLPLLLWGVWLFSRGRQAAGAVVLCLAALIRIEAFAALLWLALAEQLFKRRFRAFSFSTVVVTLSVAFTVLVYYRLQGSVARFNAGGPGAGYIYTREPSAWIRSLSALQYPFSASTEMAFEECGAPYLAVPALFGCVLSRSRRFYLSLLGIPAFLLVYVATGQGFGEVRYFQFLAPVIAALGAFGIARAFDIGGRVHAQVRIWLWLLAALGGLYCSIFAAPKALCSLALIFIAAGLGALNEKQPFSRLPLARSAWALLFWFLMLRRLEHNDWQRGAKLAPYSADALDLVEHERVPRGQRVLTEDDVIYGVLVRDTKFFRTVNALQYFNVQGDARRKEILASTDYIVLSKSNFLNYYLKWDPLARGETDPFRVAMLHARKGKPISMYGYRLLPIETTRRWTVIKVESEPSAG